MLDSLDLALNWPLGPFIKDNDILRYSKVNFAIDFPKCFEDLKSTDANFEMVASNSL